MNREIKFRAKDLDHKDWCYGIIHNNGINLFPVEVDTNTIGQFTGLHDKHSKEVYEHDILRVFDGERYFNVTVVWSDKAMAFMCCFCDNNLSPLSWFSNILSKGHEIEVIGNIFDDKELLNKE